MHAPSFFLTHLISGGLIVTYRCASRCRHCLYNCGPGRASRYMDKPRAKALFTLARAKGTRAMHIGGGEPMARIEDLGQILEAAAETGMGIDYVETNASWVRDGDQARRILEALRNRGLQTLLISISPFHAEFIPPGRVFGLIRACYDTGIRVLPWKQDFLPLLRQFAPDRPVPFDRIMEEMGPAALESILKTYWIHPGGRALTTFAPATVMKTVEELLDHTPSTCKGDLSDTSHFHMDLYGNYIPGLCAGIAVPAEVLNAPLDLSAYPLLNLLVEGGIKALVEEASAKYGFIPRARGYSGKCDLCTHIRFHLFNSETRFRELAPEGFYVQSPKTAPLTPP